MNGTNQIRAIREAAGLSQRQLAKITGITRNHISRLEADKHAPTLPTAAKLAKALNCPVAKLLRK